MLDETQMFEPMTNSLRVYGIPFLFCMLVVCLLGIKFAQLFSPIALFSVIVSILSIYAGEYSLVRSLVHRSPFTMQASSRKRRTIDWQWSAARPGCARSTAN